MRYMNHISRVLVANRGEIAVRIIRACKDLGIEAVAAVSEADRESLAAKIADRAVCIGPARALDSYLRIDTLITAALGTGSLPYEANPENVLYVMDYVRGIEQAAFID